MAPTNPKFFSSDDDHKAKRKTRQQDSFFMNAMAENKKPSSKKIKVSDEECKKGKEQKESKGSDTQSNFLLNTGLQVN